MSILPIVVELREAVQRLEDAALAEFPDLAVAPRSQDALEELRSQAQLWMNRLSWAHGMPQGLGEPRCPYCGVDMWSAKCVTEKTRRPLKKRHVKGAEMLAYRPFSVLYLMQNIGPSFGPQWGAHILGKLPSNLDRMPEFSRWFCTTSGVGPITARGEVKPVPFELEHWPEIAECWSASHLAARAIGLRLAAWVSTELDAVEGCMQPRLVEVAPGQFEVILGAVRQRGTVKGVQRDLLVELATSARGVRVDEATTKRRQRLLKALPALRPHIRQRDGHYRLIPPQLRDRVTFLAAE